MPGNAFPEPALDHDLVLLPIEQLGHFQRRHTFEDWCGLVELGPAQHARDEAVALLGEKIIPGAKWVNPGSREFENIRLDVHTEYLDRQVEVGPAYEIE
jgi:hypothetical protein